MRAWQSGALSGRSWNDYSREIWGRGRAADTCWATCHFGTQEGQERHLCSLKLDGRLLLPLLPNCFPILFQRDIGVRRPARVGVRWTLERKTGVAWMRWWGASCIVSSTTSSWNEFFSFAMHMLPYCINVDGRIQLSIWVIRKVAMLWREIFWLD